ncbi:MAG: leucine-rich repeat domain-containing protein [Prevotella sp.]|nr:leucine-rich repeat domain-containing protein [Prevotella sp.]
MKTLKLLTCTMLLLVAMAAGAETISDVTIGNLVYSLDTDTKVATVTGYDSSNKPTDVVIPNTIEYGGKNYSVTTIGQWAFSNCTSLASIDIPNSVTTIGEWAFSDCYSLASIDIPNSVTTIGRRAFCYCPSLTSVNIGESVTTIGDGAFLFCDAITSVTCLAKECPVYDKDSGYDMFSVFDTATLYVPKQSIDAYKTTAPWRYFVNVVALEVTGIEGTPTDNAPRVDAVYDIDGRRTDSMKRGLNIVRMSDGTTRKVMK